MVDLDFKDQKALQVESVTEACKVLLVQLDHLVNRLNGENQDHLVCRESRVLLDHLVNVVQSVSKVFRDSRDP